MSQIQLITDCKNNLPHLLSHSDGWCADFHHNNFTGGVEVAEGTTAIMGKQDVLFHTHERDLLVLRFSQNHLTSDAWLEITGTSIGDPENRRFFLMCNEQGLGFDLIDDWNGGSARIKLPPLPAGENRIKLQLLHTRPTDAKSFVLRSIMLTESNDRSLLL